MNESNFSDWLNDLGSKTPTPGGGAVAGINGAISAAQLKMIWEYSDKANFTEELNFEIIIQNFLQSSKDDELAYQSVRDAYKSKLENQIESNLIAAIKPSEDVIKNSEKIYIFCNKEFDNFNKNLTADLVVVLTNIQAAVESSLAMIIVNKKSMNNQTNVEIADEKMLQAKALLDKITSLKLKALENI